jgi:hypothetical protein
MNDLQEVNKRLIELQLGQKCKIPRPPLCSEYDLTSSLYRSGKPNSKTREQRDCRLAFPTQFLGKAKRYYRETSRRNWGMAAESPRLQKMAGWRYQCFMVSWKPYGPYFYDKLTMIAGVGKTILALNASLECG